MRLLTLVESEDHVCFRYRWGAMRKYFMASGCDLEALVLARGFLPFSRQLATIAQADVVVLQRRLLAWWKLKLLRRAARRLVFDIDDAIRTALGFDEYIKLGIKGTREIVETSYGLKDKDLVGDVMDDIDFDGGDE